MFVFSNIEPACMGSIAGSKENQSIKSFRLKNTQLRPVKKTDNKKYRNLDFVKLILQFYLKICFFIIGLQNRRVPIRIEISHYKRTIG